jgi:hypothetical protein
MLRCPSSLLERELAMARFTVFVFLFACGANNGGGDTPKTYTPDWDGVNAFLSDECLACHEEGGDSTLRLPSALELDLYTGDGLLVVPFEPEESRLWRVISDTLSDNDAARMPLGTEPLPEETVAHVREWILDGAPWPGVLQDEDNDGYAVEQGDCNDDNPAIYPGADEICDGLDNNCDTRIDEGVELIVWTDADGDGFGDSATETTTCNPGETDVLVGEDCDDDDLNVHPDADEMCDTIDNNCDGLIDGEDAVDATTWYLDADADGAGDENTSKIACEQPADYVDNANDCRDSDASIGPGQPETCDGADNDCDGAIDEWDAIDPYTWYTDNDGDGWGDDNTAEQFCTNPGGAMLVGGDCDDTDSTINPDATDICEDTIDQNCDGVDASCSGSDTDGDGYCNAVTCSDGSIPGDCDDSDPLISPAAAESCDAIDNDCDGAVDEDDAFDAMLWYLDLDADGYGDVNTTTTACSRPIGYVANSDDCDDNRTDTNPGAPEVCNGIDDDCNGTTDDNATGLATWYADTDGDGYGDNSSTTQSCNQPSGYVDNSSDCDDTDAGINPAELDIGDGIDNDCDGDIDEDAVSLSHAADIQALWDAECVSCHGGVKVSGKLDLSGDGYADLVGPQSTQAAMPLVSPGDPWGSYLWHKLQGSQSTVGGTGSQMPKGSGTYTAAELDTIEQWILGGALP